MNLYKNGEDHLGWHSDKEYDIKRGSTIASISIGEERTFEMITYTQDELRGRGIEVTGPTRYSSRGDLVVIGQYSFRLAQLVEG